MMHHKYELCIKHENITLYHADVVSNQMILIVTRYAFVFSSSLLKYLKFSSLMFLMNFKSLLEDK